MAAYVIFDINVHDVARYDAYRLAAAPTVTQYGGQYIVRGGGVEVLEGDWRPSRVVVLKFESADRAKRWYNSPEYQAALPGRLRTAVCRAFIVEGI